MLFLDNAQPLAVAWSEQEEVAGSVLPAWTWRAEHCLRLCRSPAWLRRGRAYGSSEQPEWIASRLQVNFQERFLGLDALHSLFQMKRKPGVSFSCVSSSVAARVDAFLPPPRPSRDGGGAMRCSELILSTSVHAKQLSDEIQKAAKPSA